MEIFLPVVAASYKIRTCTYPDGVTEDIGTPGRAIPGVMIRYPLTLLRFFVCSSEEKILAAASLRLS